MDSVAGHVDLVLGDDNTDRLVLGASELPQAYGFTGYVLLLSRT